MIMNLKHTLIAGFLMSGFSLCAATLEVSPGTLSDLLTEAICQDESLTLSGSMDVRDFNAIQQKMTNLKSIDLKDVKIEFYRPAANVRIDTGKAEFDADVLPEGAFLGMKLTSIVLPETLTTIGTGALAANSFTTLTVPAGVTTIEVGAFYDNANLETISLPSSLTSLGDYALSRCPQLKQLNLSGTAIKQIPARIASEDTSLESVTLPASATSIGQGAFAGCTALKSVSIPAAVTSIGTHAFTGSGLQTVSIPKSVTSVGDYAFALCESLTTATLSNPEATLGNGLFFYCPEFITFTAKDIEKYPDYLFTGDTAYAVPDGMHGVSTVGNYALKDTGAVQMVVSSSLVFLGDGAMEGMTALTEIDAGSLDTSVPMLGEDVFAGIDQKSVTLSVAENTGDVWNAADQWKEFNVSPFSGLDENLMPADNSVKAWFVKTNLNIEAASTIEHVAVYNTSGQIVLSASPRDLKTSLDASQLAERIYIVRVELSNGATSTFKLTR